MHTLEQKLDETGVYRTSDIGIASMLVMHNIPIVKMDFADQLKRHKQVVFLFEVGNNNIAQLIEDYEHENVNVDAKTYSETMRLLKKKVFDFINMHALI